MPKYIIVAIDKEIKDQVFLKGDSLASYEWTRNIEEADKYSCYYEAYYHWDQVLKLKVINPERYRVVIADYAQETPW